MDQAEQHRWGRALTWLREQSGRDLVVRCPEPHEADAHPAVTVRGGDGEALLSEDAMARPVAEVVLEHCLGATEPWLLVDMAVAADAIVVVEACPKADPGQLVRLESLTGGRVRLGAVTTTPVALIHVAHPPVSRRGMFRRMAAAPVVVHSSDDPRERLVESLRGLGVGEAPGEAPALALDAAACIACGVCVKACAHDALELGTAQGRTTLVQYPDRCQGDQTCVASCPSQVISVVDHHDWTTVLAGRPLPIARLATTTCDRCRITIPAGRSTCETCEQRAEDPFGVHLPPHLMDRIPAKYHDRLRG